MTEEYDLAIYSTEAGQEPFNIWLASLKDKKAGTSVFLRLQRIRQGNFGDCKDVIRVHGSITKLAKKAKISRATIYKLFSEKSNPELRTILSLLHTMGYNLVVTKRTPSIRASKESPKKVTAQPAYYKKTKKSSRKA